MLFCFLISFGVVRKLFVIQHFQALLRSYGGFSIKVPSPLYLNTICDLYGTVLPVVRSVRGRPDSLAQYDRYPESTQFAFGLGINRGPIPNPGEFRRTGRWLVANVELRCCSYFLPDWRQGARP
jgi:hypothetical protein